MAVNFIYRSLLTGERAPLKPQSDFYKREIPFDYHRSGSFDFNIIPINKAVCPNLKGYSPSPKKTKPLAPLRGSTSSKSIVGIMKSKFSRLIKLIVKTKLF